MNLKKRLLSLILLLTISFNASICLSGCSKKNQNTKASSTKETVSATIDGLDILLPEASDKTVEIATLMLLLDLLAPEDENGKINADVISQFTSNINSTYMINKFNSFLDLIEQKAIKVGKVEKISQVLPDELNNDKMILSNVEQILENIIKYSKVNDKNAVLKEYNKLYKLFVEEKEIELNGIKFKIRDLTPASRAVVNMYAETANYYSKDYISKDMYEKMNQRTNDQNSKAYLKSTLDILDNQMEEVSEVDVISIFNKEYEESSNLLSGKVNLSEDTIKNLVNYINLAYLYSDKVATKDMNQIVGQYDEQKVNEVMLAIEAINRYNLNNQNDIIPYSSFIVDEYLNTETGALDEISYDFIQFNSIMFSNKISTLNKDTEIGYLTLKGNPYFENMYKYFTKQDFTHIQNDENGKEVSYDVTWQEISDGANYVNYQTILYTFNSIPESELTGTYTKIIEENLGQSVQSIQNTITGECQKTDFEYIKRK